MFNSLIKVYDWYHDAIQPSCPPRKHDKNILAPIYYGKVSTTANSNAVEVLVTPMGTIGIVRKFPKPDNDDISTRYMLTPSCVQHRRRGASANDSEYQFFNKFSVLFGNNRSSWIDMMDAWIKHHHASNKPAGDIAIIERIVNIIRNTDGQAFKQMWDPDSELIDDRTIFVFTDNGKKIFDNNPELYRSYHDFYEEWCRGIYEVVDGVSTISGTNDLIVRTADGSPVAFGIGYSNGRKFITKTNANATLDLDKRFNVQSNFSNYNLGLRDIWKIHSTFDYLSEQQHEWDMETRNIFFFVPSPQINCSYEQILQDNKYLNALKQYYDGYKWGSASNLDGLEVCYLYWTSSSNGRSSISDFQVLPAEKYVENIRVFYKFFIQSYKFCLYRIPNQLETDSLFVKKAQHEMICNILNQTPISPAITRRFIAKALNPIKTSSADQASRHSGYKGTSAQYYYRNVLETTVGILFYNNWLAKRKGAEINMALDRTEESRSYLYGRLVAIYQRAEEVAMYGGEQRVTNAEKNLNAVSMRPFTSIENLERRTRSYMNKLHNNNPGSYVFIDSLLQEVYSLFKEEERMENTPLDSNFIIGYYCQRQEFYKKNDKDESAKENDND